MLGNRQQKVKDRSAQEYGQTSKSQVLLREIDDIVDFNFFRDKAAPFFSPIGRKSIDPVVMLKMMLLGYLFELRSDPEIIDECIDRRSFREFLGYDNSEDIPVYTNFCNWRKRIGPEIFEESIENIICQCEEKGMRIGNARLVDSTRVKAKAASKTSLTEIELHENPDDYLQAFIWQTGYEDPKDDPGYGKKLVINMNDPEARLLRYDGEESKYVHKVHWEVDSKTGLVMQSTVSFKPEHQVMLDFLKAENREVISATADTAYGEVKCYKELERMGIKAYIPYLDHANDKGKKYHLKDFTYDASSDSFTCPSGKILRRYTRQESKKRTIYRAEITDCTSCPMREKCIDKDTKRRTLTINDDRPYIDKIKLFNRMPDYNRMMRRRKTVMEGTFGHAKAWCGMRFARGIGRASMRIQAALTAIVINIKKLVTHVRAMAKGAKSSQAGGTAAFLSTHMHLKCLKIGILRHFRRLTGILQHSETILNYQGAR